MPEISRFYGIIIKMFYNDHTPPHFHAEYGGDSILVDLNNLQVIAGKLPTRATKLVLEWASEHQSELQQDWQLARDMKPLQPIDPLD
ncbi:MAG: DUF4160 domain-containing protein [Lacipirellulaceae bacterium]